MTRSLSAGLLATLLAALGCAGPDAGRSSTGDVPADEAPAPGRPADTYDPRADRRPAQLVWTGQPRSLVGFWVAPSLSSRDQGAHLVVSVGLAGPIDPLRAEDVAAELRAGGERLACVADDALVYTETRGRNAHATLHCDNPRRRAPTSLRVIVRGAAETFAVRAQLGS